MNLPVRPVGGGDGGDRPRRRGRDERGGTRFVLKVPDEIKVKVELEIEDDKTELEIELRW